MMRRGGMEKSIQSTARISQSGDCLMAKDKPLNWKDIEIERAGKTIRGRYALDGGVVIVRTGFGEKATQLGGSSGESVARMLLGFLGDEGKTSPP
jgi:hypothetical protein